MITVCKEEGRKIKRKNPKQNICKMKKVTKNE